MRKVRRFVVLQVAFCASEKLEIPSIYYGLKEFGIQLTKIQWKNENCLKLRVWIDQPGQIWREQISRGEGVSAIVDKVQGYFKGAVVVATGKFPT